MFRVLMSILFSRKVKLSVSLWGALALVFLTGLTINAQEDRISEGEIHKQEQYIAAFTPTIYGLGSPQEQIEKLLDITSSDPMNDAAYYVLAKLYFEIEDFPAALDYARRAWNIDRDNSWYAIFMAETQAALGAYAEAADTYKELYDKNPGNLEYAIDYAYHLMAAGQNTEALEIIEQTERNRGFNPEISFRKIRILEKLNKSEEIVREWEKLIDHDPADMSYRLSLAQHYLAVGNSDKVKETLNEILIADPENVRAQMALSQFRDEKGRYSDSELEGIVRDPSKSLDLKINSMLPEMVNLNPDSTEKNTLLTTLAEEITQQYPENAKAWSLLGDFYFNLGNTGKATQSFAKACKLTKSVFSVWQQYLNCLSYTADYKQLELKADEALMYFPNQAITYYYLAYANVMQDNHNGALSNLMQAQYMTGRNYMLLQRIAGMQAYIQAVKNSNPDALNKAINSYATAEEVSPEAVWWLLKAYDDIDKKPEVNVLNLIDSKVPEIAETMDRYFVTAKYYQLTDNDTKALEYVLKSYYQTGYTRPETAVMVGDLYLASGDKENARMWYKVAASQAYSDKIISKKLKETDS